MALELGEERTEHSSRIFPDLPRLLTRFFDDVLDLINTQFALFRTELREDASSYLRQIAVLAIAAAVALLGFIFLSVALAFGLDLVIANRALSFLIVGGVYLAGGAIAAMVAVRRLRRVTPPFDQSLEELEKDKQWIKTGTRTV